MHKQISHKALKKKATERQNKAQCMSAFKTKQKGQTRPQNA